MPSKYADKIGKLSDAFGLVGRLIGYGEQARTPGEQFARDVCLRIGLDPDAPSMHGPDEGGIKPVLQRAPMKKQERIVQKADAKYDGDVTQVGDIARFRILFNDPEQIRALRALANNGNKTFRNSWAERGVTLTAFDDAYYTPKKHGYIGLDLKVTVDLGKGRKMPVEIQLMHDQMQATDRISHLAYEEIRQIDAEIGVILSGIEREGRVRGLTSEEFELFDNAACQRDQGDVTVRNVLDSLERVHLMNPGVFARDYNFTEENITADVLAFAERAFQKRSLSSDGYTKLHEVLMDLKPAIDHYERANIALYEGDARRLHLIELRDPKLRPQLESKPRQSKPRTGEFLVPSLLHLEQEPPTLTQ